MIQIDCASFADDTNIIKKMKNHNLDQPGSPTKAKTWFNSANLNKVKSQQLLFPNTNEIALSSQNS